MRNLYLLVILVVIMLGISAFLRYAPVWSYAGDDQTANRDKTNQPDIKAYFSPKGGCSDAIKAEINNAQKEVLVQAYSFTSDDILTALISAQKRQIKVEFIQDYREYDRFITALQVLLAEGITTYIDAYHFHHSPDNYGSAHNKIMIIDQRVLITGSFNFSREAEFYNGENLLVIKNAPELISEYYRNYEEHKKHSERVTEETVQRNYAFDLKQISEIEKLITPPTDTEKADVDLVYGMPKEIKELTGKGVREDYPLHIYTLLPSRRKDEFRAVLYVTYRQGKVWRVGFSDICISHNESEVNTLNTRYETHEELQDLKEIRNRFGENIGNASWHQKVPEPGNPVDTNTPPH